MTEDVSVGIVDGGGPVGGPAGVGNCEELTLKQVGRVEDEGGPVGGPLGVNRCTEGSLV